MAGRFLLDTNIVIALFAADASVQAHLKAATEVFVPSVVLGELYYGARKSGRPGDNIKRVDDFAGASVVLACDAATATNYGQVKDGLRTKGRPIPENDIWVGALALQYGLTLVSRDTHFNEVTGLVLEVW
jgi:tRNA(fMet)-specific endonuclease VapC